MRSTEISPAQRMIAVFLCLLLPLLSVGCVPKSETPDASKVVESIRDTNTAREWAEDDDAVMIAEQNADAEPWRQIYQGYLMRDFAVEEQQGYVLIYMDEDDIPELVEIGDCEASGCRIINYSQGEANVTELYRLYFSYIEKGNLLCNSGGIMDSYYDSVYRIVDGKVTLIASGFYGAEDNSNVQYDEAGEPIYLYEWNGVRLTKEAYENALNDMYDFSKSQAGYDWEELFSVEEMLDTLKKLD